MKKKEKDPKTKEKEVQVILSDFSVWMVFLFSKGFK